VLLAEMIFLVVAIGISSGSHPVEHGCHYWRTDTFFKQANLVASRSSWHLEIFSKSHCTTELGHLKQLELCCDLRVPGAPSLNDIGPNDRICAAAFYSADVQLLSGS
jgi:hypothetical protein